jgi:hypothetical protein
VYLSTAKGDDIAGGGDTIANGGIKSSMSDEGRVRSS